ncbi:MAG: hypothetical protein RL111_601 [Pseudomonadota bacterium]
MRWVLWIIVLFALAVLAALGLGNNNGMVTLFWPPYRADVSLTLAVLLVLALVVMVHLAWQGVAALTHLPVRVRQWRFERKLAASQQLAMQALFLALGGRFVRADAVAQRSVALLDELVLFSNLSASETEWLTHLRWLNVWTQGECKQSLRDLAGRDQVIEAWQRMADQHAPLQRTEVKDAATLIRARWALDARDPVQAMGLLNQLSKGAGHRSLTHRLKLKALRALGQHADALKAARALAKHGGFSSDASARLLQSLAMASLRQCQDASQLDSMWRSLDAREQRMPSVALAAAELGLKLRAESAWIMERLNRTWTHWMEHPNDWDEEGEAQLLLSLQSALQQLPPDTAWLERAEQAHLKRPRHAPLQALYGLVCMQHALWGKAVSALDDAQKRLEPGALKRKVHASLALMAESRSDTALALRHWKAAAQS